MTLTKCVSPYSSPHLISSTTKYLNNDIKIMYLIRLATVHHSLLASWLLGLFSAVAVSRDISVLTFFSCGRRAAMGVSSGKEIHQGAAMEVLQRNSTKHARATTKHLPVRKILKPEAKSSRLPHKRSINPQTHNYKTHLTS